MALETFVKVSRVNNLSDARYCAGMGVDVIGFNLVPETENFVTPEKFSEITDWLAGVDFAGEFEGVQAETVVQALKSYTLQYIQISDEGLIPELSKHEVPLIFKINMDNRRNISHVAELLQQYKENVSYFLFESEQESFHKDTLQQIFAFSKEYPVLLGYGVTVDNVHEIIRSTSIAGIALMGEEEIRAGYKDFEKLAEILELIEVDDFEE